MQVSESGALVQPTSWIARFSCSRYFALHLSLTTGKRHIAEAASY